MTRLPEAPFDQPFLRDFIRTITFKLEELEAHQNDMLNRIRLGHQTISTTGTVDPKYSVVYVDASVSSITLRLPDPYQYRDRVYYIKRIDDNVAENVIVSCVTSGVLIDGSSSNTISGSNRDARTFHSDGTNYWSLADHS